MTEIPTTSATFECPAGTIIARTDGQVVRATGIRFAQAARFEVPSPQPPADEPIDATSWSPACPQRNGEGIVHDTFGDAALGEMVGDERAQYVSVTVPVDRRPDEALPVMVWIHGGSYIIGAADAPCHDPAALVAEQRVVVVSVTYRLGLFGFLGDDINRPANLGLLDMIEALRWVQRNIASFGGDPNAVTVFGERPDAATLAGAALIVGSGAFAHKAGLHASAIKVDPDLYQHIEPKDVGNDMRMLVSDMAGRATVELKSREFGVDLTGDDAALARVLAKVKDLEQRGYTFDAADASFDLLLRREVQEESLEYAQVESWRIMIDARGGADALSESTVKATAGGQRFVATGEGNGPVNALDQGLRHALVAVYPEIERIELIDYKVRILDAAHGTDATTRVLIEHSDEHTSWTTVGVAPNIVEASWQALVDGITYGLMRAGVPVR